MDVFTPVVQPVVQQNQQAVQFELERVLAREVQISDPAGAGLGSGTLYTAPALSIIETATEMPNRVVVTKISVNCVTITTMKLHVVPALGSADDTNLVWSGTLDVPSSTKTSLGFNKELTHVYMEPGDTLQVTGVTTSPADQTVYFFVHGKEYF